MADSEIMLSTEEKERICAILDSWHKTEFFIPYSVEQNITNNPELKGKYRFIPKDKTAPDSVTNFSLPTDFKITGYRLFIGLFDKSEIGKICDQSITKERKDFDFYDNTERTELEGQTCFARINLSEHFEPLYDQVAISTVPWAMGLIREKGLKALSSTAFESARKDLANKLANFESERSKAADSDSYSMLSADDLKSLYTLFCDWARYVPSKDESLALLVACGKKTNNKNTPKQKAPSCRPQNNIHESNEHEEIEEYVEPHIDILNSFFIEDIEKAIAEVKKGITSGPLYRYLCPTPDESKIDVYSFEGREKILRALHPLRMNRGHWFDDPNHTMSLMQQFAINKAIETKEKNPLIAVNGPPGTGKTTLLRDLFAQTLVARASVLAGLEKASDAFLDDLFKIEFQTNCSVVRRLIPELTGFEMVVTSSNNAAVDNISKELPKNKSLGDYWKPQHYLQEVAHKVSAQTDSGKISLLEEDEVPWGLFSCTLGNQNNRFRFSNRLFFTNDTMRDDKRFMDIRSWIKSYDGPSFSEAANSFKEAELKVEEHISGLADYADLMDEIGGKTIEAYIYEEKKELHDAEKRLIQLGKGLEDQREILTSNLQKESTLIRKINLHKDTKPGFLARLFCTDSAQKYNAEFKALENDLSAQQIKTENVRQKVSSLESEIWQTEKVISRLTEKIGQRKAQWHSKYSLFLRLKEKYARYELPSQADDLEEKRFQIHGIWNSASLSKARTELFKAALTLHEAWLADVGRIKDEGGAGFAANIFAISNFLTRKTPLTPEKALCIWQSLFMIVPVVSTTFASFARQFNELDRQSLGWLFIDEAGQAVPQAATGALRRAQKAIIVGDPLQIEPVFTVPAELIRSISNCSKHTAKGTYSPERVSVQNLADRASIIGSWLGFESSKLWIGSPLRIHRRCFDPMFKISNSIAYENKMITALDEKLPSEKKLLPFESAWINIGGRTEEKQIVPEQSDFIVTLIKVLYSRDGVLPQLYIITPFKAVKNDLIIRLLRAKWEEDTFPPPPVKELKKWCRTKIGTVHTFQGRENDIVIMVLGADKQKEGAVRWASAKPNLLNVAITRAKKQFFIVGDKSLWAGMNFFSLLGHEIKTLSPDIVLEKTRK